MTYDERKLIGALVGEHTLLYGNSAIFHAHINTLASMIPLWIDAMASHAAKHEEDQRVAIEALMRGPK